MADQPIQRNPSRCYVYEIVVGGIVRYIGKGTGDRARSHLAIARTVFQKKAAGKEPRQPRLYYGLARALRRGTPVEINIVAFSLNDDEAFHLERQRISGARRGQLWNVLSGGQGATSEDMKKLFAVPAVRQKRSEAAKIRGADPEYRAAISEALKVRWTNEEFRTRIVEITRARQRAPENRKAASDRQSRVWEQTDFRARIASAWSDADKIERQSRVAKEIWASNPNRAKARFARPDSRRQQSEMLKAKWADPAYRKMQMEARAKRKNSRA